MTVTKILFLHGAIVCSNLWLTVLPAEKCLSVRRAGEDGCLAGERGEAPHLAQGSS